MLAAASSASSTSVPTVSPEAWAAFLALIVALLLADLFVFHREAHEVSIREAVISSVFWITIGVSLHAA